MSDVTAIIHMNLKLMVMEEKDFIFAEAAPGLFWDNFAKEAKDREDQLRCLDRASSRGKSHNFQHGRHSELSLRGRQSRTLAGPVQPVQEQRTIPALEKNI